MSSLGRAEARAGSGGGRVPGPTGRALALISAYCRPGETARAAKRRIPRDSSSITPLARPLSSLSGGGASGVVGVVA